MSGNIDAIFYINLEHRTDRRESIEQQLNDFNLKYQRFSAIRVAPPMGILGCGLSHLQVLKMAKEAGYKNVLIFEDDFIFTITKEEFEEGLERLFAEQPNFDVCMLSYYAREFEQINDHFIKILYGQTASGYIVNSHYYDTLIDLYSDAMPKLEQTQQHWIYANDIVWVDLQKKDNWIAMKPRMGKQMDSFSDNSQTFRSDDC